MNSINGIGLQGQGERSDAGGSEVVKEPRRAVRMLSGVMGALFSGTMAVLVIGMASTGACLQSIGGGTTVPAERGNMLDCAMECTGVIAVSYAGSTGPGVTQQIPFREARPSRRAAEE